MVVVEVIVVGEMTVKVPDGAPEAIFLVAMRVNVDALVMVVEQNGEVGAGGAGNAVDGDNTRHLQTDDTN